jgi:hypothetical protein
VPIKIGAPCINKDRCTVKLIGKIQKNFTMVENFSCMQSCCKVLVPWMPHLQLIMKRSLGASKMKMMSLQFAIGNAWEIGMNFYLDANFIAKNIGHLYNL